MTLPDDVLRELDALLAPADAALVAGWPGEPSARQPVHTLYLPADRADADVVTRTGAEALEAVAGQAPPRWRRSPGSTRTSSARCGPGCWRSWPASRSRTCGSTSRTATDCAPTTRRTGTRPLPASCSRRCAAKACRSSAVSGSSRWRRRRVAVACARSTWCSPRSAATVPPGFVVTLPKVTSVDQVEAMVLLCERLESAHGFPAGSLRFEVQVETPQAVLGADGSATVARVVHAAGGRCTGLHYGTYDYSASLGVAAAHQAMDHPVADHAKAVMQVAAAQTGVRVSDGSTNVLPLGDPAQVEAAWALHARLVRRSLERGLYQGWDLHPAQLPTRYLATFAFYRSGLTAATKRLRNYLDRRSGGVLDEPATAFALAGFLLRGLDCAALDAAEVVAAGGPGDAELRKLARREGVRPWLDALPAAELRSTLLAVCASTRWADRVAGAAPYGSADVLLAAADRALAALDEGDVDDAMAGHPRIGERSTHTASQREQSGVGDDVLDALAEGNREYEQRFGHVYLVCASGRSGDELLAVLRSRLGNDPAYERTVVRAELGDINRLRLQRLLDEGGPTR